MHIPAGLTISETIVIESPAHLSDVLIDATAQEIPVLPVGGGTCLSTGTPTGLEYHALDLSRISGIENYIPTDMTASFLAGTPMRDVRSALAENGQELPIDLPVDDAGTIGGLVASGYSGARRFGQGTLKDLLIGCEYVRGDGLMAKAGGMTVKNVSGFEISRLLHGSWGALAVLTRVNLKVLPIPRVDRTWVWEDHDLSAALERQVRLLTAFPGCIALETGGEGSKWSTAIRFTGRDAAMQDYRVQLANAEGEPDAGLDQWPFLAAATDAPILVAHNPVEPARALALQLHARDVTAQMSISLPTGSVRAQISPDRTSAAEIAGLATGLWMIEGGDHHWKRDAIIWGGQRGDHAVARSIKQQFDPADILNRGRLFI